MRNVALIPVLVALIAMLGCDDSIRKEGVWAYGTVQGRVEYHGAKSVSEVRLALFLAGQTSPLKTLVLPASAQDQVDFPVSFQFEELGAGSYTLSAEGLASGEVVLRTTGQGPVMLSVEQPEAQAIIVLLEVVEPTDTVQPEDAMGTDLADVDLVDSVAVDEVLTPSDVTVTPVAGKAALFGTVAWAGDSAGTLTIAGFSTNPPSGPPTLIKYVKDPKFPQFYSVDNVTPGTHYVIVYLDVVKGDGMSNNPETDPVSAGFRSVMLDAGDSKTEDFWLMAPAAVQ